MFIQGQKNITQGTIGGRLITKACVGEISNIFNINYLSKSTMNTIINVFNIHDALIIFMSVNQYLNNLSLVNPTKANLLYELINEDPLLICSLDLIIPNINMPIRWIETDGNAYINTNIFQRFYPISIETNMFFTSLNGEQDFFGNWNGRNGFVMGCNGNNFFMWGNSNWQPTNIFSYRTYQINASYGNNNGDSEGRSVIINGVQYSVSYNNYNINSNQTIGIFSGSGSRLYCKLNTGSKLSTTKIIVNHEIHIFAPFILGKTRRAEQCIPQKICPAGTMGMIDIETGIFYTNANTSGNFNILGINYIPTPIPTKYLSETTTHQIINMFGNSIGELIINATYEYLNNLAERNILQSQQLAYFINEDPMIVCSLDLNIPNYKMPIRWHRMTNGYWDTTLQVTRENWNKIRYILDAVATTTNRGNNWWANGIGGGSINSLHVGLNTGSGSVTGVQFTYANGYSDIGTGVNGNYNTHYRWDFDLKRATYKVYNEDGTLACNKVTSLNAPSADNTSGGITIGRWHKYNNINDGNTFSADVKECLQYIDDELVNWYIPFKKNGQFMMLNLVNFTTAPTYGDVEEKFGWWENLAFTEWTPNN